MRLFRCALLIALLILPASFAPAKDRTVVRIGTEGIYPPFNYVDENGRLQGFEIDIAKALCAEAELRCEFMREDWNDMIPALLAHRFDAVFGSMSITKERKAQVLFSEPYYRTPATFVARKASNLRDTSPEAMKGRVLGGQRGTIHADHLLSVYAPAGAKVKLYESQNEAQLELARGRLDAILVPKVGIHEWLAGNELGRCCTFAGPEIRDPDYVGEGVGIAMRPQDRALKEKFDLALDAILANGTYKRINDKYFPFSVY